MAMTKSGCESSECTSAHAETPAELPVLSFPLSGPTTPYGKTLAKAETDEYVQGQIAQGLNIANAMYNGDITSDQQMRDLAVSLGLKWRDDIFYSPMEDQPGVLLRHGELPKKEAAKWGFTTTHHSVKAPATGEVSEFDFLPFTEEFAVTLKGIIQAKCPLDGTGEWSEDECRKLFGTQTREEFLGTSWSWKSQPDIITDLQTQKALGPYIRLTRVFKMLGLYNSIVTMEFYEHPESKPDSLHFKYHIMQPHVGLGAPGKYKVNEDFNGFKMGWSVNIATGKLPEVVKIGCFRQAECVENLNSVMGTGYAAVGQCFTVAGMPSPANLISPEAWEWPEATRSRVKSLQGMQGGSDVVKKDYDNIKTAFFRSAHVKFD